MGLYFYHDEYVIDPCPSVESFCFPADTLSISRAISDHTKSSLLKVLMVLVFLLHRLSLSPWIRAGMMVTPEGVFMCVNLVPMVRAVALEGVLWALLLEEEYRPSFPEK